MITKEEIKELIYEIMTEDNKRYMDLLEKFTDMLDGKCAHMSFLINPDLKKEYKDMVIAKEDGGGLWYMSKNLEGYEPLTIDVLKEILKKRYLKVM